MKAGPSQTEALTLCAMLKLGQTKAESLCPDRGYGGARCQSMTWRAVGGCLWDGIKRVIKTLEQILLNIFL